MQTLDSKDKVRNSVLSWKSAEDASRISAKIHAFSYPFILFLPDHQHFKLLFETVLF